MNISALSIALRNEIAKTNEIKAAEAGQTVGRFDERDYNWDSLNVDTGDVRVSKRNITNAENTAHTARQKAEAAQLRNKRLAASLGLEESVFAPQGWADKGVKELADIVTETMAIWADAKDDKALEAELDGLMAGYAALLPSDICHSMNTIVVKAGLGQVARLVALHPRMSTQAEGLSVRFDRLTDEERVKLDKLRESVAELETATPTMLMLANAARKAAVVNPAYNFKGEQLELHPRVLLVEQVIKSEASSRNAKSKWTGIDTRMSEEAKAQLAVGVFKIVPDWVNELELMSDIEIAERQMESLSQAAFSHQARVATTATVAEMTGKNTTGNMGSAGMFDKEQDMIAANLARSEYQPKRGVFLDTEGNVIKPEGDIIAALPIAQPHQATGETLEDLAKQEFLTDLCMDIPFFIDARDEARASADPMVLIGFNKKLNAAAALYAADMDELDAALAMVTKAVNAVL